MLRKSLAVLLSVIMIIGSITCGFSFTVSAEGDNMIITPTAAPTSLRNTTADSRLTAWSRSSSGKSTVTTENGYTVVSRTGIGNGSLFTNTFTVEKNSTYRFSFEIKAVEGTSFTYTNSSGEVVPRGVNFVLNDFNVVKSDGTAYNTYSEGHTDYAHTYKANDGNPTRSGFTATWSHELADGSIHTENQIKYSSWGRKIGTSEASTALKTVDLSELYSDWRTVTCEFTLPDEDVYTASDIAIGFMLPGNASNGGIYVRNVTMYKVIPKEPVPTTLPISVVDADGNPHHSADDITASTTVTDNGDDTYLLTAEFDAMDSVNEFVGWFEGDKLISENTTCTVDDSIDFANAYAKILCHSAIDGGLGFESYKQATIMRVDPAASKTPPYDDRWGIIWDEYEYGDINFTLSTTYGDVTTQYTPTYDAESGSWSKVNTTVKPYSGNAMFYFAARYRTIVRKLDNLKPNTEYELSFYTYNLSEWDYLSRAYVADSYLLPREQYTSTDTIKVYGRHLTEVEYDEVTKKNILKNKDEIRNWTKITVSFTTDFDDTELYLYLKQEVGNNASATSKQFIDNLTCAPLPAELPKITEVPVSVTDVYGNASSSVVGAATTATYNEDDTVTVTIDYDDMDTVNVFKGWYEGEKFLSNDTTYTLSSDVNEHKVKAVMLSRNVITGGMGFENYKTTTNLRVSDTETNGALENIAPFDDRWGQIYNSYQQTSDFAFDIKATYGNVTTQYTPAYDAESGTWTKASITVKPHGGNSMFYFATRFRTIVRKLDNLKPNTNYQLSFYVYNLSEWDFLNTAVIADSYLLGNGKTTSTNDIKVYSVYKADVVSENGENILKNENEVRNWHKITINFTTDADDTELYLHLRQEVGNNSSSTSKQFIDDLTCTETLLGYAGNAIRAKNEGKPQALRYKFFMSSDKTKGFGDMTTAKIGLLAVKNEVCGSDALEIGKSYNIIDVEVNTDTNLQYVEGDSSKTYFTAALYNIGKKDAATNYNAFAEDYSVRPYIIYEDNNGSEVLIYGDTVNANVFNVMYAIVRDNVSDEDVASAKAMLENEALAEKYYEWQPKDSWYIGESRATDYAFSFAVVGDTQKTTGYYPDKLHYIYDWIINNADSKNIEYVMGLGDITEWLSPNAEWPIAIEQLERLEAAGIDQSIVRGNHDGTSYFDKYVTMDKFGSKLTGSYDNTMKNTYRLITINGIKYMMLTLNLFPSDAEVAWAEQVIAAYPDYNVILTTHAYFDHDMSLTQDDDIDWVSERVPEGEEATLNCGQEIFDKLVNKYSNIVLVMCGHRYPPDDGPNYRITTREDGSKVMEMMINPQRMESNGGRSYGMLAMLYISEDGRSVQLEYFSTISGMYYMEKFQFDFELDLVD